MSHTNSSFFDGLSSKDGSIGEVSCLWSTSTIISWPHSFPTCSPIALVILSYKLACWPTSAMDYFGVSIIIVVVASITMVVFLFLGIGSLELWKPEAYRMAHQLSQSSNNLSLLSFVIILWRVLTLHHLCLVCCLWVFCATLPTTLIQGAYLCCWATVMPALLVIVITCHKAPPQLPLGMNFCQFCQPFNCLVPIDIGCCIVAPFWHRCIPWC